MQRALVALLVVGCSSVGAPGIDPPTSIASGTLSVRVERTGARVHVGDAHFGLAVRAIGRGPDRTAVERHATELASGALRTTLEGGATEWWRAMPDGLEHGVDVSERPGGEGPLVVEVGIEGATLVADGDDVALVAGARRVRYASLVVRDAAGRELPSHMRARGTSIALEIDDREASYPIVVDPLVAEEEATLTAVTPANGDQFGREVGMSGDGSVAVVATSCLGACGGFVAHVDVFRRSGRTWTRESTLTPFVSGSLVHAAISADGARIVTEGGASSPGVGGMRIYAYGSGTWSVEQTVSPFTGAPVSITTDGTRIARGNQVYLRTGTSWALEGTLPTAVGAIIGSVAISGDGTHVVLNAVVVGGTMRSDVLSFVGASGTWSLEATLYTTPSGTAGFTVATDDTGTRAAIGHGNDYAIAGSVDVYVRSGTSWTSEATLVPADTHAADRFGAGLAFSGDATRLLVGAPDSGFGGIMMIPAGPGTMRLYTRSGSTWSATFTMHRSTETNGDDFGASASIARDGTRAIGGAPAPVGVGARPGSAWVFRLGASAGTSCSTGSTCASGFCVDGVCCATSCGGGATNDCTACSAALTGGADGTCAPLSATAAPMVTCRAAADLCDQAEVCAAGSATCPGDAVRASGATCRASAGACDPAEVCDGTRVQCPGDALAASGAVCRPASASCDVAEQCDGTHAACPTDALRPAGYVCLAGTPGTCDEDDVCDGVGATCAQRWAPSTTICGPSPVLPCDAPDHCSGTSADCIAALAPAGMLCRAAAGSCDVDELCDGVSPSCPIDVYRAMGAVCRASLGTCDPEETCEGGPTCPANVLAPPGAVCRAAAGACDVAETCSGLGAGCPVDAVSTAGSVCRAAVGACDVPEQCDGVGTSCPTDTVLVSGSICRASLGGCDPAERCDGATGACPGDARSPAGTECGGMVTGSCSTPGTCDGTAVACSGASPLAAGHVCLAADPSLACDVDDVCDGSTDVCAPRYALATITCGGAPSGVCDAQDHCSGSSADCVAAFVSGVECRPSAGGCDPAEVCSGGAAACPPDQVQPAGTACRASSAACDPAEMCDGTSLACPLDQSTCGGADAGPTDAGARDGGGTAADVGTSGSDGGGPPAVAGGCACRATSRPGSPSGPGLALAWLALPLLLARRRARRRRARRVRGSRPPSTCPS